MVSISGIGGGIAVAGLWTQAGVVASALLFILFLSRLLASHIAET
jgi:hypothetical protein